MLTKMTRSEHLVRLALRLIMICLVTIWIDGVYGIAPLEIETHCAVDYCGTDRITAPCIDTTPCSDFNGCYTGSPLSTCPSTDPLSQSITSENYRLTFARAYIMLDSSSTENMGALELTFGDIAGVGADEILLFGSINQGFDRFNDQAFDQEITDLIFIYNETPSISAIVFIQEDSSRFLLGATTSYDPNCCPEHELSLQSNRLIGLSATFGSDTV